MTASSDPTIPNVRSPADHFSPEETRLLPPNAGELAAVFTATNTMLSAVAARTREIGILGALGFRPPAIFTAFLLESLLLGLAGGLLGSLLALPLNGVETGTTNLQSFTEVAFAFRVTPEVLGAAVAFALLLGLLGGAWPAWRAARLPPARAMRRV
jgi:putative ABC transport system permease protein